ncbi:class I SAM-dependent methyltransferase [Virgisporangium ochraceum]
MEHANSFGSAADLYDAHRPGYPADAVRWALGAGPLRVADLHAGTGILSRLLRDLGHRVVAVEPDDRMRDRLTRTSPGVEALDGTAEAVPLPDASVDAVVAGQAYHWFDPERAHPEIARVLRPGGVFAALWNDADVEAPWTLRFVEIVDGTPPDIEVVDFGPLFTPARVGEFRHAMPMSPEGLLDLTRTRSPYLVASPSERETLLDAVRRLMTESGLAGRFPLPLVTRVHRASVVPGG